ncbi:hypothetical protein [Arenimonas sp. SCN 70-307]|uniref:hypothetical protein n=1 Tax=Arenimonas sp. SCN 70-307 TaxID=1660089 RepID=UPI0025C08994|nr:hypothetical protein [Arenimonas sp. SCN 70-307]
MKRKPRIFHGLVNYGTQSGVLAMYLRRLGYRAVSVTRPDAFGRVTDVSLPHGGNLFQKIARHAWARIYLAYCFFTNEIFHFYFGTTLANGQWDLPLYRIFGKKVVMEYLGSDVQKYGVSVGKYKWTNIRYKQTPEEGLASDRRIDKRLARERKYADKLLVCAPCYSEFVTDAELLPLAIDLEQYEFTPLPAFQGTFRLMHAPTHRGNKGTSYILDAVERLKSEGHAIELDLVEGVSHEELKRRYRKCHVFIDQIVAGWYGTASIEALAMGRPTVVSIRDSYMEHFPVEHELPFFNADPDSIYDVLRGVLGLTPTQLQDSAQRGREFVESVHDASVVVRKLVSIYEGLWRAFPRTHLVTERPLKGQRRDG